MYKITGILIAEKPIIEVKTIKYQFIAKIIVFYMRLFYDYVEVERL